MLRISIQLLREEIFAIQSVCFSRAPCSGWKHFRSFMYVVGKRHVKLQCIGLYTYVSFSFDFQADVATIGFISCVIIGDHLLSLERPYTSLLWRLPVTAICVLTSKVDILCILSFVGSALRGLSHTFSTITWRSLETFRLVDHLNVTWCLRGLTVYWVLHFL